MVGAHKQCHLRIERLGQYNTANINDQLARAFRYTFPANKASFIINGGAVVLYDNRVTGTALFTYLASNATDRTQFSRFAPLVVVGTQRDHWCVIEPDADDAPRTCLYAEAAMNAFFRVNLGNAMFVEAYRTELADRHTGAVSQATVDTGQMGVAISSKRGIAISHVFRFRFSAGPCSATTVHASHLARKTTILHQCSLRKDRISNAMRGFGGYSNILYTGILWFSIVGIVHWEF